MEGRLDEEDKVLKLRARIEGDLEYGDKQNDAHMRQEYFNGYYEVDST